MINGAKNEYRPDYATPPGAILEETLEARGIKKKDFAERCGLSTKHISQIINSKAPVTPETAIRFERVLGISDDVWNNLESNYRAFEAREKAGRELENQVEWANKFPVNQLVKRKLIEKPRNEAHKVEQLLRFFGVASIQAWEDRSGYAGLAFRHSPSFKSELESLATWLRVGELIAQSVSTPAYNKESFLQALTRIRSFTSREPEEFQPQMEALCHDAGVVIALAHEFPKTRLSGACRWITPEKAMIQLSLRHKTNDHFWFSFFHEAAHILNHTKKTIFIDEKDGFHSDDEKAADAFAANFLIPDKAYRKFVTKGKFSRERVIRLAEEVNIAPGIVVGRLQHDRHIRFSWLNDLKVSFRLGDDEDRS